MGNEPINSNTKINKIRAFVSISVDSTALLSDRPGNGKRNVYGNRIASTQRTSN